MIVYIVYTVAKGQRGKGAEQDGMVNGEKTESPCPLSPGGRGLGRGGRYSRPDLSGAGIQRSSRCELSGEERKEMMNGERMELPGFLSSRCIGKGWGEVNLTPPSIRGVAAGQGDQTPRVFRPTIKWWGTQAIQLFRGKVNSPPFPPLWQRGGRKRIPVPKSRVPGGSSSQPEG